MVHSCCALILQWCRKWRCVGTSVLVCGGRRLQEFPNKEYQVPDKEYQVPRQGISGSQQGAIIFQTVKLLKFLKRSLIETRSPSSPSQFYPPSIRKPLVPEITSTQSTWQPSHLQDYHGKSNNSLYACKNQHLPRTNTIH